MNRFLGYFSLSVVLFWLLFSYLPSTILAMRQIALPAAVTTFFPWISVGLLALFLLIQLALICSALLIGHGKPANGLKQSAQTETQGTETELELGADSLLLSQGNLLPKLNVTWEILWTFLPLLMTVGLAIVGYQLWSGI